MPPPIRTVRTPEKEQAFLDALATGLSIAGAARAAGLGRQTVYDWRNADSDFAARWDSAIEEGTDHLEDVAIRRAEESSDTLLIFMLKGRRGEKYADRVKSENVNTNFVVSASPEEEEPDEWLAKNRPSSGDPKEGHKPH